MGSFITKIKSLLTYKQETKFIIIGLDNAGKTTLLYKMKLAETVPTIPTIGFNVETIEYKNLTITAWDIGGQHKIRQLWQHYYNGLDGIIFMIDSCDDERFDIVKYEIGKLLSENDLRSVPILFYANKQDARNAHSVSKIVNELNLHSIRDREWFVQACCSLNGDGIYEGLEWIREIITKK